MNTKQTVMTNQERNEAVARKLGWQYKMAVPDQPMSLAWVRDGWVTPNLPDYVGSIEAAWEIVEHLRAKQIIVEIGIWGEKVRCVIHVPGPRINEEAEIASTAICNAFLKL